MWYSSQSHSSLFEETMPRVTESWETRLTRDLTRLDLNLSSHSQQLPLRPYSSPRSAVFCFIKWALYSSLQHSGYVWQARTMCSTTGRYYYLLRVTHSNDESDNKTDAKWPRQIFATPDLCVTFHQFLDALIFAFSHL